MLRKVLVWGVIPQGAEELRLCRFQANLGLLGILTVIVKHIYKTSRF